MKASLLALLGTLSMFFLQAQRVEATLAVGDLAVIRVNNSTDSFSYVALRDIPANEVLKWTDSSWNSSNGAWRTSENSGATITSASAISAGSIFNISTSGLNNGGEQVFLYTGDFLGTSTSASAGFVYGVNWDNSGWLTTGSVGSTSVSYMPSTLGGASVELGTGDAWYYNGPTAGTQASLLSAINNPANWSAGSTSNTTFAADRPGVTSFTVASVPEASSFLFGGLVAAAGGLAYRRHRRG